MLRVLSSSVMLTWLCLRSGSLWTCAEMHASPNLPSSAVHADDFVARHGHVLGIDDFP
ncbi:hypothetical protein QMK61_15825 [Fulvimonas sp. R45]|nr:hypothetical protein [Fulvimonas sp. R45]